MGAETNQRSVDPQCRGGSGDGGVPESTRSSRSAKNTPSIRPATKACTTRRITITRRPEVVRATVVERGRRRAFRETTSDVGDLGKPAQPQSTTAGQLGKRGRTTSTPTTRPDGFSARSGIERRENAPSTSAVSAFPLCVPQPFPSFRATPSSPRKRSSQRRPGRRRTRWH